MGTRYYKKEYGMLLFPQCSVKLCFISKFKYMCCYGQVDTISKRNNLLELLALCTKPCNLTLFLRKCCQPFLLPVSSLPNSAPVSFLRILTRCDQLGFILMEEVTQRPFIPLQSLGTNLTPQVESPTCSEPHLVGIQMM